MTVWKSVLRCGGDEERESRYDNKDKIHNSVDE